MNNPVKTNGEAPRGASPHIKVKSKLAWPEMGFAICLLIIAAVLAFAVSNISATVQYSRVGPQAFPIVMIIALMVCGVAFVFQALRGGWRNAEEREEVDWVGLALVGLGIIIMSYSIRAIGFIPAGSLLFVMVAAGFGSRRYGVNILAAIILTTVVYIGLTRGLTISLPEGPIERLFLALR